MTPSPADLAKARLDSATRAALDALDGVEHRLAAIRRDLTAGLPRPAARQSLLFAQAVLAAEVAADQARDAADAYARARQ